MNEYDYQEVVDRVDGLNSVSTLKKWRLKIESLTDTQFKESRVRTGRNSYSKVYLFTEDDLNHFQAIADKKSSLGLESAILSAYGFSKENDSQKPIRELVDELEVSFKEIQEDYRRNLAKLKQELEVLLARIQTLEKRRKRNHLRDLDSFIDEDGSPPHRWASGQHGSPEQVGKVANG